MEVNVTSPEVDIHFVGSQRSLRRTSTFTSSEVNFTSSEVNFTSPEVNVQFAGSQRSLPRSPTVTSRKSTASSPEVNGHSPLNAKRYAVTRSRGRAASDEPSN